MYKYKQLKDGSVSVYKHNMWQCIIDHNFAVNSGYETAMGYCKDVFK